MPITVPVLGKVSYEPIKPYQVTAAGSGFPHMRRMPEDAGETFKMGVPLALEGGFLREADFTGDTIIVGFSTEPGHNLAADGVAEQGTSEGTAPNQASSKIIPVGAWMKDGNCGVYIADDSTIFSIALKAASVFTQALLIAGTFYGIAKDATSGFWYLDDADTSGNNAILELLGMDPSSPNTAADGARVLVKVKPAARYFG